MHVGSASARLKASFRGGGAVVDARIALDETRLPRLVLLVLLLESRNSVRWALLVGEERHGEVLGDRIVRVLGGVDQIVVRRDRALLGRRARR